MKWDGIKLTKVRLPKSPKRGKRVTDKERLDWLEKEHEVRTDGEIYLFLPPSRLWSEYESLRQAIDHAIALSGQRGKKR